MGTEATETTILHPCSAICGAKWRPPVTATEGRPEDVVKTSAGGRATLATTTSDNPDTLPRCVLLPPAVPNRTLPGNERRTHRQAATDGRNHGAAHLRST